MASSTAPYIALGADLEVRVGRPECRSEWELRRCLPFFAVGLMLLTLAFCCWTGPASGRQPRSSLPHAGPLPVSDSLSAWSVGGIWSGGVAEAAGALRKTKAAMKHLNGTARAQNVRQTWSGAVKEAEKVVRTGTSAVNHSGVVKMANNTLKTAEREAESSFKNASRAVHHANAQAEQSNPALAQAEADAVSVLEAGKRIASNASSQMEATEKRLAGQTANCTYIIPPLCQDAIMVGWIVASGAAAPPALLSVLGFAEEGVEADSLAALWQSTIGNVKKDGTFARLQSASARGLVARTSLQVVGLQAVASSAFCAGVVEVQKSSMAATLKKDASSGIKGVDSVMQRAENSTVVAKVERKVVSSLQSGAPSMESIANEAAQSASQH